MNSNLLTLSNDTLTLPCKKYEIIYADPPWDYRGDTFGARIEKGKTLENTGGAKSHYNVMPIDEICQIPVSTIADENCLLFMWVGSPKLDEGMILGDAWGFKYITIGYVWDKQITCPGYYTNSQIEICLIFKKGKIPQPRGSRTERQFWSIKKGRHSAKPFQIKESIVKMFPKQSKIELFARREGLFKQFDDGWDYWGNES